MYNTVRYVLSYECFMLIYARGNKIYCLYPLFLFYLDISCVCVQANPKNEIAIRLFNDTEEPKKKEKRKE